jgi:hypothetical protein
LDFSDFLAGGAALVLSLFLRLSEPDEVEVDFSDDLTVVVFCSGLLPDEDLVVTSGSERLVVSVFCSCLLPDEALVVTSGSERLVSVFCSGLLPDEALVEDSGAVLLVLEALEPELRFEPDFSVTVPEDCLEMVVLSAFLLVSD